MRIVNQSDSPARRMSRSHARARPFSLPHSATLWHRSNTTLLVLSSEGPGTLERVVGEPMVVGTSTANRSLASARSPRSLRYVVVHVSFAFSYRPHADLDQSVDASCAPAPVSARGPDQQHTRRCRNRGDASVRGLASLGHAICIRRASLPAAALLSLQYFPYCPSTCKARTVGPLRRPSRSAGPSAAPRWCAPAGRLARRARWRFHNAARSQRLPPGQRSVFGFELSTVRGLSFSARHTVLLLQVSGLEPMRVNSHHFLQYSHNAKPASSR